ncbi:MAG: dihydropteroate synthase [Chthoniobacterales bacterium]
MRLLFKINTFNFDFIFRTSPLQPVAFTPVIIMHLSFRGKKISLDHRALIVGILNVTPDSFSDGGAFLDPEKACAHGLKLLAEGADILDIGGASSRPGADLLFTTHKSASSALSVNTEEELRRIMPVLQAVRKKTDATISIDTSKASVAEAALTAGADIINDITGLQGDERMGEVVAKARAGLILMHMQGTPETMQKAPSYLNDDVVTAVIKFLTEARKKALSYGIDAASIILDPGIGFGKTFHHNLSLLRAIPDLTQLGAPVMIGHSRKAFLSCINEPLRDPTRLVSKLACADAGQEVLGAQKSEHSSLCDASSTGATQPCTEQVEFRNKFTNRLAPGLTITSLARQAGAMLFRVHEPQPHWEAVRMVEQFLKQ